MLNLRWSWHLPTVELFESIDPAGWAASGGDPVAMLSSMRPGRLADLAADEDFLRRLDAVLADLRGYTGEPRWYQSGGRGRPGGAAERDRLLLARVRHHRRAPAVFGRPRHPGGRPPEVGQRPRRPDHRRRPALPARVLHPVAVGRRLAGGALSGRRPQRPAAHPAAVSGRRAGQGVGDAGRGQAPDRPGVAGPGRPGAAADARLLRGGERARAARGDRPAVRRRRASTGSARNCCSASAGVRAVRAFCQITGHPEPEVFHTNEGHAGFLGLERIREYVAAGLSFDEALELSRAGTVFTTHTPVPAGIDRFPRELIERYFASDGRRRAAARPGARVRRGDLPGRRPARVQHGRDGHAVRAAGQRRVRAARRGQQGDVRGPVARVRHRRGADRLDHQRRARAHLGRARGLRPGRLGRARRRPTPSGCGGSAASSAPGWSPRPGGGCASPGSSGARPGPS